MPELPEVETIRRGLLPLIRGRKIRKVEVREPKSFLGRTESLSGVEVIGIGRKGKALMMELGDERVILIHLRMTGQLIYRKKGYEGGGEELLLNSFAGGHPTEDFVASLPGKQTRVVIEFDEGKLFFNDQRKFGFMKVMTREGILADKFLRELAAEPWEIGEGFYEKIKGKKGSSIKAALLDQKIVAGIGNIYADEALFLAKIHPEERAGNLSREEAKRLMVTAGEVMERSIKAGGSTMANYVRADGTRGDYLELFAEVFQRQGQNCRRCGGEIIKTRVAGRGTHFCPNCQRRKND